MFVVKRGEYFRKYNIFEVDFDSGDCISMGCIHKKRIHDFPPKFYSSNLKFCAKITENGTKWPPLSWDMPDYILKHDTFRYTACNCFHFLNEISTNFHGNQEIYFEIKKIQSRSMVNPFTDKVFFHTLWQCLQFLSIDTSAFISE